MRQSIEYYNLCYTVCGMFDGLFYMNIMCADGDSFTGRGRDGVATFAHVDFYSFPYEIGTSLWWHQKGHPISTVLMLHIEDPLYTEPLSNGVHNILRHHL